MSLESPISKSADWMESFAQQYDMGKIPEKIRDDFKDFLLQRAAARDYYVAIPVEKFDEGIGIGDSPRKELIHQVGHSLLRIEGLETGVISHWEYGHNHPTEQSTLIQMSKDDLVHELDETTVRLYTLFSITKTKSTNVQLPYNKTITGAELLRKIAQHDALHIGMLVKFGDLFGIPRPTAMKNAWG